MERSLKNEKERKEFKKNYIEEKLETHLISNYPKKNTKSEKRNQFYNFIDSNKAIQNLWFYIIFGNDCFKKALMQKFGKHDFSFREKSLYKCYVLEHNNTHSL